MPTIPEILVEKLRKAANIPFIGPAYNKQGAVLNEHVIVRLDDMTDLAAALKKLEAKDQPQRIPGLQGAEKFPMEIFD